MVIGRGGIRLVKSLTYRTLYYNIVLNAASVQIPSIRPRPSHSVRVHATTRRQRGGGDGQSERRSRAVQHTHARSNTVVRTSDKRVPLFTTTTATAVPRPLFDDDSVVLRCSIAQVVVRNA